jgi:hypothetical protein
VGAQVTEHQVYEVFEEYPDFELRRYPGHLVAETEVGGSFELAGNMRSPGSPATSAVTTGPRALAMTAPVVQEPASQSCRYVVGFVMPADVSPEGLPDPLDSHVRTRRVPAETAAALRF